MDADASGLATHGQCPLASAHAMAASTSVVRSWSAVRSPAARTASIMSCLSRRAGDSAEPLVRRPSASLSESASGTPASWPASTNSGARSLRSTSVVAPSTRNSVKLSRAGGSMLGISSGVLCRCARSTPSRANAGGR
ncbi:hypothetical protein ACFQV2_07780 [Actinokineospora soli]|uniref:Uncharacterized protein n=1 Tax=Actinokineospora soli TaxID=1048753 RepID=A0ABW2TL14_9PSEU